MYHAICKPLLLTLCITLVTVENCFAVKSATNKPFVVTHVGPSSEKDKRGNYERALLKLLLEKTRDTWGDFKLVAAPGRISTNRTKQNITQGKHQNYIVAFVYDNNIAHMPNYAQIDFPIYRGLLGYRVCFVSDKQKYKVERTNTIEQLKYFSVGQGMGWTDVEILRHNGFHVTEVNLYESLFKMLGQNRFALFCRGLSEYLDELTHYNTIARFSLDNSFLLHYTFPVYFYTHKKNTILIARLKEGLQRANEDGSFHQLWEHYFSKNITHAKLYQRKIYHLYNPTIEGLEDNYTQHFYYPEEILLKSKLISRRDLGE